MAWFFIHSGGLSLMEGDEEIQRIGTGNFTTNLTALSKSATNLVINQSAKPPTPKKAPIPKENTQLKRSAACDTIVKKWEGYHKALPNGNCTAYLDPGPSGLPITIGFGTTRYNVVAGRFGRELVKMGDILTKNEAEQELLHELTQCELAIALKIGNFPCTQGMFDSLVSFSYNLGIAGAQQQINRVINGEFEECAKSFDLYVKAGGKVLQGLVNRRNEEEALFRSEPFPSKASPVLEFATLKKTNATHTGAWAGLDKLELIIGTEFFSVASGARGAQFYRRPIDPRSVPGNLEPIPQGNYSIGTIAFAGGKDNYEGNHGPGLGPVWIPLDADFSDDRGAFGFHLDSNIGGSPGSAGCVVFRDIAELKRFVAALRRYDPKTLEVNWGL